MSHRNERRTRPAATAVWHHLALAWIAGLLLTVSGCGGRTVDPTDAGGAELPADSKSDAGNPATPSDAGASAGEDSGTNAGTDAGAPAPDAGSRCVFPDAGPDTVVTDYGAVRGLRVDGGLAFLGVPFAEPPVGELRFRPPEPPRCWADISEATTFGSECLQKRFDQLGTTGDGGQVVGSEDCLTLNVWTPALTGARPVLVYIHGGGQQQGSASQLTGGARLFEGAKLAVRSDAVVVTLQYRVGPLGYLYAPGVAPGNLGLLDQVAALTWVKAHAARFGGDATRVMLFGESAGAVNTCMHLVMPASRGLFSRALMQSGACVAQDPTRRLDEGAAYLRDVGCGAPQGESQRECLARLEPSALLAPLGAPLEGGAVQMAFGPTVDGNVLPERPMGALEAGRHAQVPLVVGANADEMAVSAPPVVTPTMVEALYLQLPQHLRAQARALYPPGATSAEARASYVGMLTDAQFVCQARRIARAVSGTQSAPVFRYFFDHPLSGPQAFFGSFHGLELFFVFASLEESSYATSPGLSSDDRAVVSLLQRSWAAFAAYGNPSTAAVAWPVYSASTDPYVQLSPVPLSSAGLREAKCDFWDSVPSP